MNFFFYKVTFVDYGDTHENIPSTSFRQLSVLNRYVPPFAVNCSFRWSVHVGEQEIDKVLAFTECTDNVVCHAVFGEKAGDLQIVDTLYAGDVNIFKFLFGDCKVDNAVEIQVSELEFVLFFFDISLYYISQINIYF